MLVCLERAIRKHWVTPFRKYLRYPFICREGKVPMDSTRSQEHAKNITDLWRPVIEDKSFYGIHQIRSCPLTEEGSKAGLRNIVLC
jgi:hypothetical protein